MLVLPSDHRGKVILNWQWQHTRTSIPSPSASGTFSDRPRGPPNMRPPLRRSRSAIRSSSCPSTRPGIRTMPVGFCISCQDHYPPYRPLTSRCSLLPAPPGGQREAMCAGRVVRNRRVEHNATHRDGLALPCPHIGCWTKGARWCVIRDHAAPEPDSPTPCARPRSKHALCPLWHTVHSRAVPLSGVKSARSSASSMPAERRSSPGA